MSVILVMNDRQDHGPGRLGGALAGILTQFT